MPTQKNGYYCKDGGRVPGTTTVIGRFKNSAALMQWAFKQGKEGKASLYEESGKAADIGTAAHAMVEGFLTNGDPNAAIRDKPMEIAAKAIQAYDSFTDWWRQARVKIVATELPLVSEQYRYGGTLDAVGEIDGKLCLLDWKTSNAVYGDHIIQLAAYRQLWNETHPETPLTGACHICRFSKEAPDFAHHSYGDVSEAWELFTLYRKAYDLDKLVEKRAA